MPTRVPVLLQSRKSALALSATNVTAKSSIAAMPWAMQIQRDFAKQPSVGMELRVFIAPHIADSPQGLHTTRPLRTVNEDCSEVIHIGQSWTWKEEIAQFFKE